MNIKGIKGPPGIAGATVTGPGIEYVLAFPEETRQKLLEIHRKQGKCLIVLGVVSLMAGLLTAIVPLLFL